MASYCKEVREALLYVVCMGLFNVTSFSVVCHCRCYNYSQSYFKTGRYVEKFSICGLQYIGSALNMLLTH